MQTIFELLLVAWCQTANSCTRNSLHILFVLWREYWRKKFSANRLSPALFTLIQYHARLKLVPRLEYQLDAFRGGYLSWPCGCWTVVHRKIHRLALTLTRRCSLSIYLIISSMAYASALSENGNDSHLVHDALDFHGRHTTMAGQILEYVRYASNKNLWKEEKWKNYLKNKSRKEEKFYFITKCSKNYS